MDAKARRTFHFFFAFKVKAGVFCVPSRPADARLLHVLFALTDKKVKVKFSRYRPEQALWDPVG